MSKVIANKSTFLSFCIFCKTHYYQAHKPVILGHLFFLMLEPWVNGLNPTLDIDVIPRSYSVLFCVIDRGLAIGH